MPQIIKDLDENPAAERRIFVYALKNGTASSLMTIPEQPLPADADPESAGHRHPQHHDRRGAERGGHRGPRGRRRGGGRRRQGAASTSSSSSSDTLSEETYFEADPNTNSLLVMTSSKNYDKIKPIIEELDKPVGQVLIKVLFAELTHSNDVDWGTEFSMLNLNGMVESNRPRSSASPASL